MLYWKPFQTRVTAAPRIGRGAAVSGRARTFGGHHLGDDVLEGARDVPAAQFVAETSQVGDVADVVTAPVGVLVLPDESLADHALDRVDRLQHRRAVVAAPTEVVHGAGPGIS